MQRLLLSLAIIFAATPALAQVASPMQQYLQTETGYVPQVQPIQAQQAQIQPSPYNVAQSPGSYAAPESASSNESRQITSGVSGMNN